MPKKGLVITGVNPNSIGAELELKPGDAILEINGRSVRDILDYKFLTTSDELDIKITTASGEEWLILLEKDTDQELGLDFGNNAMGPIKQCHNKCIFCFVDQMPPNMRNTLYVKDDDYRHSFLYGNFITLTNVDEKEMQRIIEQRISPLYISVHTTNPKLRQQMMNNPRAAKIMKQLLALAEAGITMHCQVVLCPGFNDGAELERTVNDLAGLWPSVQSLAVVPVGLTKFRDGLVPLRLFTSEEAVEIIRKTYHWQQKFFQQFSYPFLFAADEFYVMAAEPVPPAEIYCDHPHLENGVGLVRLFMDEWMEKIKKLPKEVSPPRRITLVTGSSAYSFIELLQKKMNKITGLTVQIYKIPHRFFGSTVTVAGLLTGSDLLQELQNKDLGEQLVIPAAMLKNERDGVLLDDITLKELSRRLGVPVLAVNGPSELVKIVFASTSCQ